MKFLEEICFYLIRSWNDIFVIVKTNVFMFDGGRLVLGLFHISSIWRLFSAETPYFRFGKIVFLSKESIDSETLSKSIYTSNMIEGGGQGGLKRKNY